MNKYMDYEPEMSKGTVERRSGRFTNAAAIIIAGIIIAAAIIYGGGNNLSQTMTQKNIKAAGTFEEEVTPSSGVVLPVVWGNLGAKLISVGAIDPRKFQTLYEERGIFTDEYRKLLFGQNSGQLKITKENAGYILNLFWALGLSSKNPILDSGEMIDPRFGGAKNFASTGGFTLAKGDPMDHYSRHLFFNLTAEEQALVDKISRGIYRPCCNNSTHFPDCNHGMAMLGLLELMASQGASERDMWQAALAVNSYWFPDTYLTIAAYMKNKGIDWKDVNPQEVLGAAYSSGSGFADIASKITSPNGSPSGGGCSA